MIKNIKTMVLGKRLLPLYLLAGLPLQAVAQQVITGRVITSANTPVAEAIISSPGCETVRSAEDGTFTLQGVKEGNPITVWHDGYFQREVFVRDNNAEVNILMTEELRSRYNETTVTPYGVRQGTVAGSTQNLNRKDFALGSMSLDRALQGEVAGLSVINKSGMTGEGSALQLRGIHSFMADNTPLVVINGVPYMPDANLSDIIGGYSRSIFQALNGQDIRNVTVLKGAEAAVYGSMGAAGVIMIETDQASSTDMDTRISFSAIAGTNWRGNSIPLMGASEYKNYLSDIALTYYPNMEMFFNDFSFLSDPAANKSYLYQYDTDWQKEISHQSTSMDYLFRVEGGDNIAKYNISLGYMRDEGTLKNTHSDRYQAQINASVLVSKQFEIRANINTAYLMGQYQEQGFSLETNPLLAAYRRAPLLSPYQSDMYGNLISTYASYRFGAIENSDFWVSNPVSLVNTMTGTNRQYDMNTKIQLIYTPLKNLQLNALVGMYYNYNQEEAFIPGIDNEDIVPRFDQYGEIHNAVQVGVNHAFNMFYNVNASYKIQKGELHKIGLNAGWQALTTSYEYDAAFGRDTPNDYYHTLTDVPGDNPRYFSGYNNKWNWMNAYAHADWTYDNMVKIGLTASYDGASSIGNDARRMSLYPAVDAVFMAKNVPFFNKLNWLEKLNVYANYTLAGNSRFSSKYSKYYYTSKTSMGIAGLVRANTPNTKLQAERDRTVNIGLESSLLRGRLQVGLGYYDVSATNVIIAGSRSSAFGSSVTYSNEGGVQSTGMELTLSVLPVSTKNFRWTVGGNLTTLHNRVTTLGALDEIVNTLADDAQLITRVGEDPYAFYGLRALGVFSTTADAEAANLMANGRKFEAGDIYYLDRNEDGVIDAQDREIIGSATPDFFGSFFTRFEYRQWALDMTFAYSVGNDAYNAVRRITESGSDFSNQATSVNRRWLMEGQQTDMPRVQWGDPVGNNAFSSRWIEDASYLKLRDVTLSYTWQKPLLNFLQGGTLYVTGQNLLCFTKYLGSDPEFAYSYSPLMQGVDYAKVAAPRSVKVGVNLKF